MRSTFLALALLAGLGTSAHAITKPTRAQLTAFVANAKLTPIKPSTAHNSQAYRFEQARSGNVKFKLLHFGNAAADAGKTAYILRRETPGLKINTAYVTAEGRGGSHLVGKVKLPLF